MIITRYQFPRWQHQRTIPFYLTNNQIKLIIVDTKKVTKTMANRSKSFILDSNQRHCVCKLRIVHIIAGSPLYDSELFILSTSVGYSDGTDCEVNWPVGLWPPSIHRREREISLIDARHAAGRLTWRRVQEYYLATDDKITNCHAVITMGVSVMLHALA